MQFSTALIAGLLAAVSVTAFPALTGEQIERDIAVNELAARRDPNLGSCNPTSDHYKCGKYHWSSYVCTTSGQWTFNSRCGGACCKASESGSISCDC